MLRKKEKSHGLWYHFASGSNTRLPRLPITADCFAVGASLLLGMEITNRQFFW